MWRRTRSHARNPTLLDCPRVGNSSPRQTYGSSADPRARLLFEETMGDWFLENDLGKSRDTVL